MSESTSYCGWIARCKDFELLSIARQNPSLLAGLAICSPSAWRLEFRLPVDPELLYIGGEW
ncbi:MAG: hypothetical protein HQ518_22365 [Rhodopirellula sp.]|nr:hypothetical protein [Rhodopirellula sp.]